MIIVTDTASDILESEAKSMDIKLITIPSIFEDETIDENTEESFARFYKKLDKNEALPASLPISSTLKSLSLKWA